MRGCLPILPLLLAALLATAGCSKEPETLTARTAPPLAVKGVVIETVRIAAVKELLEVAGSVRTRTSAVVSARIPGNVRQLHVREGDRVRRGQLLAQLDALESRASAAAAEAAVDEAVRGVEEARSRQRLADKTFERYGDLFDEQVVSRQEYEVRLSEKDVAAQVLARAESRLEQAMENAKGASAVAGYTRVTAPISGVIASRQVDLGTTVFPGQPLLTIEDDVNYQLELALPENMVGRVGGGTPLRVSIDAAGDSFNAVISEIVPTADPASRTFVAKVPLKRKGLKSGMFGRGMIELGTVVNAITVPSQALVERGALVFVWTVDKEKNARMRLVKSGGRHDGRTLILSGLSDGDRVIVTGTPKIDEGARVE